MLEPATDNSAPPPRVITPMRRYRQVAIPPSLNGGQPARRTHRCGNIHGRGRSHMTGSSTSSSTELSREQLPSPRTTASGDQGTRHALAAIELASARVLDNVATLTDRTAREASLLPGWTRGHVVTHLARNADALVNLLTWARTGIEHPMYLSRADRDAAIEEGSERLAQVLREDLLAASDRFAAEAERMSEEDWAAQVAHRTGRVFPASAVPDMRLFELWVHLVDLDLGVGFADIEPSHHEALLDVAVRPHRDPSERTVRLNVQLPDGGQRSWELTTADTNGSMLLSASSVDALAWLSGRADGSRITGTPPRLAGWG